MDMLALFPAAARPAQSFDLPSPAASEHWTCTEQGRPSSGASLCSFTTIARTHVHAVDDGGKHDTSAWDGVLEGARAVAVLATLPFGCVLHAAAQHALRRQARGERAAVVVLTTAAKEAITTSLAAFEGAGTPMEWIFELPSTAMRQALDAVELVHTESIEQLIAAILQLYTCSTSRPTLLVVEGLSHLGANLDVSRYTYLISLLRGVTAAQQESSLLLVDDQLEALRLPISQSARRASADGVIGGLPAPPQELLQEVSLVPILFNAFDYVCTTTKAVSVNDSLDPTHAFGLLVRPGHRLELRQKLEQAERSAYHSIDVAVHWRPPSSS